MNKKPCNWSGCISTLIFLLIVIIFIVLAILYSNSPTSGIFVSCAVVTALFGILFLSRFLEQTNNRIFLESLKSLPEIKTSAKVISKTNEITKEFGKHEVINTIYYTSFLFLDGSRENFVVDINTYNTISENDTGILTYKKNDSNLFFVCFQPDL